MIKPSFLDFFVTPLTRHAESRRSRQEPFDAYILQIARDIEQLFNTPRTLLKYSNHLKQLNVSLLTYGLPSYNLSRFDREDVREEFNELIVDMLKSHEPRLTDIEASLYPYKTLETRVFNLEIKAILRGLPLKETVSFLATYHPQQEKYFVNAEGV